MKNSLADQLSEKFKRPLITLKKLQYKIEKKDIAVTDENIKIGSIVYLPMSNNDKGFVVKKGKAKADKMNVVVGFSEDHWAVATLLINTEPDESTDDLSDCQFPLYPKDYKGILKHKSTLNCAKLFEIPKNRLKAEGNYKGELIQSDLNSVLLRIEETIVIEPKEKKKYGIKDKSKQ